MASRVILRYKQPNDVLLNLDQSAAELVRKEFARRFVTSQVWTEEDGTEYPSTDHPGVIWCIDPIDGSNNVALGLPLFGSLAARRRGGDHGVDVAVACSPIAGSTTLAVRGQGVKVLPTTWRSAPLRGGESLADVTVSWVQGYGVVDSTSELPETLWRQLRTETRRVLSTWAPAVDLNLLAVGSVEAVVGVDVPDPERSVCELVGRECGAKVSTLTVRDQAAGRTLDVLIVANTRQFAAIERLLKSSCESCQCIVE